MTTKQRLDCKRPRGLEDGERMPAHWADTGCKFSPSCFSCQFSEKYCIYDLPWGKQERLTKALLAGKDWRAML
jgi:hypothetical protein